MSTTQVALLGLTAVYALLTCYTAGCRRLHPIVRTIIGSMLFAATLLLAYTAVSV